MLDFLKRYFVLIISIIYLLWPIDLIADVFLPFGLIDDAGVLFIALLIEIIHIIRGRSAEEKDE